MLRTLPLMLRNSGRAWQPAVHDCLFLVVIAILSLSLYVADLGFYNDDWALLSSMHLSSDQSLVGVFTAVDSSQDNEIRPIQFLGYAVPYKLFGLNPLGYHLINAIFFGTSFAFLYLILAEFRQPRALCLAIPIIYMLMPAYSTDRFWIAAHATNISMCLSFLGIYAHLRALRRRNRGFWGWEVFAILCVVAAGLAYEVFLPLVLATMAFLFISELAADWPASANRRSVRTAALRQGSIVLAIVLLMLVKAKWATRVGRVEVADFVDWIAGYFLWVSHYRLQSLRLQLRISSTRTASDGLARLQTSCERDDGHPGGCYWRCHLHQIV